MSPDPRNLLGMNNTADHHTFAAEELDQLRKAVSGPVLLPGDEGYDDERTGFELSVDHRPDVIVGATNAADVTAAVRFAADHDLPAAVLATGHAAVSSATEGVFVTTRRMTGVRIDPDAGTARVEAGARWSEVLEAAGAHGLAPLSGSSTNVGAIGYLLGGGLGLLSRRYGNASDHVRSLELVTADGELRQVSADEHEDLFWGVRGSRGNLGVVTSAEIELFSIAELYGGGLYFDGADLREVLTAYLAWTRGVPDEVTSSVMLVNFPDLPFLPEPLRGRFVVHVRLAYLGNEEDGDRLFQPLREVAQPLMDTVAVLPYTQVGTIHGDPSEPMAGVASTAMLKDLDAEAIDTFIRLAGPEAQAPYVAELRHLGGALARPAESPSAVGYYPDAAFNLFLASMVQPGTEPTDLAAVQGKVVEALKPWLVDSFAPNFLGGQYATPDRIRAAYSADDYERLRSLKTKYDPRNTFRYNLNIPPA